MPKRHFFCVIMAGGVGSRFWPLSKSSYPKQFHDILGAGRTLIQMTYDRMLRICPKENIYVVTNERYTSLVKEQIPELEADRVLSEPFMRNTAPCIAYASWKIQLRDPEAIMVVAPSDHLIVKEDLFIEKIGIAIRQAKERANLVTLGIKPNRPDTGYGYIQFREAKGVVDHRVRSVKTFTEKPDLELANKFLESGDFYWNSGIFVWSVQSILKALEQYLPEMHKTFAEGKDSYNTAQEAGFIRKVYETCENISIDYGIMEKSRNTMVVLADFGWSDLGTWGSLYTHLPLDKHKNAVVGKNVMLYNSSLNMVHLPNDKLAVIQGLHNYIVVDSENVLLICKKEDEQRIREFVNDVKLSKGDKFV